MKFWTERLTSQVEMVLQPNPSKIARSIDRRRSNEFCRWTTGRFYFDETRSKNDNETERNRTISSMYERSGTGRRSADALRFVVRPFHSSHRHSEDLGSTLIKCGQSHQKLALVYKEFLQSAMIVYIQPLRSYLEGEMKSICVRSNGEEKKIGSNCDLSERTADVGNETSRSRRVAFETKEKSDEQRARSSTSSRRIRSTGSFDTADARQSESDAGRTRTKRTNAQEHFSPLPRIIISAVSTIWSTRNCSIIRNRCKF